MLGVYPAGDSDPDGLHWGTDAGIPSFDISVCLQQRQIWRRWDRRQYSHLGKKRTSPEELAKETEESKYIQEEVKPSGLQEGAVGPGWSPALWLGWVACHSAN